MILIKRTDSTDFWTVYHRSLGNSESITLNSTGAKFGTSEFNSTSPTSTVFTVDLKVIDANANNGTYVAYLFAHDDQSFGTNSNESIIKCGSYTGNGSRCFCWDPVIDLGFEPQFVLLRCKRSGGHGGGWYLLDSMRGYLQGVNGIILCKHKKQMQKTVMEQ